MQIAFRILGLAARLLLALGAVCLLLGLYLLNQSLELRSGTLTATGEVVSYMERREGDVVKYRPQIRFTTEKGDIVSIAGQLATESKRFAIGAKVPVAYKPEQPMSGRLSTFTDNWLGPLVAGLVGVFCMLGGMFVRKSVKREAAKTGVAPA